MVNAKKLESFIGHCIHCSERIYLDTVIKKQIVKFGCSNCPYTHDTEEEANFCCTDEKKLKELKQEWENLHHGIKKMMQESIEVTQQILELEEKIKVKS